MRSRIGILLLTILLIQLWIPVASGGERVELGVYDPCPDPSCDPSSTLSKLREAGANEILVTLVDDEGRALYPSNVLPVRDEMVGVTLETIRVARRLGMRVYAWINLPHGVWLRDHPDWIAVLSDGRPIDHFSKDYFHKIVPPSRVVRERECVDLLRGLIREIASLGVDGIDINDNFQFSDVYLEDEDRTLLTSYDGFTVRSFERDTGIQVPGDSPREWAIFIEGNEEVWRRWVEWRAEQVTELVRLVTDAAREARPGLEVRPHLLIWDPLETYGIDFPAIAGITGSLYVMIPPGESRMRHYRSIWMARRVADRVVASTYLGDLQEPREVEVRRRALWIASAGADGIYINWEGVGEERYRLIKAAFDEFVRVKTYRPPDWLRGVRVVSVYAETPGELNLAKIREQGASLVELDVGLSSCDRLYGDRFGEAMEVVRVASRDAHSMGMRLVVYIPALEVVCDRPLHEEWTQESLDGRKLVVGGDEIDVPWIEPGQVDMWMSPLSPHREEILERVKQILRFSDGIWLDVPHLPEYLTEEMSDLWPDASEWSRSGFEEEYWESPPGSPDDPSFPLWLRWRHDLSLDFVMAVAEEAFARGKVLMVESSACDAGATEVGFDPVLLRFNPLIVLVPEIGPPGDEGFINASEGEWLDFYAMVRHARGSLPRGVVIPLTYGGSPEDSSRQLGILLPLMDGFFETNSGNGLMTGTVGVEFRRKAFWLVRMLSGLERVGRSRVGVLFSSLSRDLVDTYVPGPYDLDGTVHMRAFRAAVRELARAGISLDVVPLDMATSSELSRYDILIAPEIRALDRDARSILSHYRGKLLVIGRLGVLNERGEDVEELRVGARVGLKSLPSLVLSSLGDRGWATGAGEVEERRGILPVEFGGRGCEVISLVNLGGAEGRVRVPSGWSLDFDSLSAEPVNNETAVPRTFLLIFRGDGGGASRPDRAKVIASAVDRSVNSDLISRLNSDFRSSGTVISLGGPVVDDSWESVHGIRFVRDSRGVYRGLEVGNITYRTSYGKLDYAVIERTRCGGFSFYRVAGVTRYGTRAALMWLMSKGVNGKVTLLEWRDNGDGSVQLGEVTVLPSEVGEG